MCKAKRQQVYLCVHVNARVYSSELTRTVNDKDDLIPVAVGVVRETGEEVDHEEVIFHNTSARAIKCLSQNVGFVGVVVVDHHTPVMVTLEPPILSYLTIATHW